MTEILEHVLELARRRAPAGLVLFDLDSTLFDNRPRQVRIFREFGQTRGVPELLGAEANHWQGWDLRVPLRNLGLSPERIVELYPDLREFWRQRFFTSEYCREDDAISGAPEYVNAVSETGARIVYLTGRHEGMRSGTAYALARHRFPVSPDGASDGSPPHLIMKPTLEESDDTFKVEAHARVRGMGPVVAAFDNEPIHVNDLRRSFPEALVVHLATDHSGRPVQLGAGIPSIPDFRMPLRTGAQ